MYLLFYVLTFIHRIALVCLLIGFALVPLFVELNIVTIYVALPTIFILLSISTIYVENTLNKYQKHVITNKNNKRPDKCLIRYGICCLHH